MEREKNDTVNINVKNDSNEIILKDKENNEQKFKYDQVFDPSSTQEEIFSTAVSPIIEQVCWFVRSLDTCYLVLK